MDGLAMAANTREVVRLDIDVPQLPLSFASAGQVVKVLRVRGRGEMHHHLENLGFVEGARVTVVCANGGNLIVEVKGSQVAIDKQVAMKVVVSS